MEKEFSEVFENVINVMQENSYLASKIQEKIARLDEHKKLSNKVNDYLELYVESVLPTKTIIDYDRMHKLERIQETLRDTLIISDDAVESKITQLEESYKVKKAKCETEVAKIQAKLNESVAQSKKLKKRIDQFKAAELLESKVKDLPTFEARRVRKALSESTTSEIENKFDETLKTVLKEADKVKKTEDAELTKTLETEINNILEADTVVSLPQEKQTSIDTSKIINIDDNVENDEDDFETIEIIKTDENGEIILENEDLIDEKLMKQWCMQSIEFN